MLTVVVVERYADSSSRGKRGEMLLTKQCRYRCSGHRGGHFIITLTETHPVCRWCHCITFSKFVNKNVNTVTAMLPKRWWPILSSLSLGHWKRRGGLWSTKTRECTLSDSCGVFSPALVMDNEAHVTWTKTCVPSSKEFSWIGST